MIFATLRTAALLFSLSAPALAEPPSQETLVLFHTVCVNCHEGECSGRLSFESGAPSTRSHVERHAGGVSDSKLVQLFAMLRHVKETCSHYPLVVSRATTGIWEASEIAAWRNDITGAYFIPLGVLDEHRYRIELEFAAPTGGAVRIADSRMDTHGEERLCNDARKTLTFGATPNRDYYLYLKSDTQLRRIVLSPPQENR